MSTAILRDWQLACLGDSVTPAMLAQADWRPVQVPSTVQTSPFGLPKDQLYRLRNTEQVQ